MTNVPSTFDGWMSHPTLRRVLIRNAIEYELQKAAGEHAERLEALGFHEDIVASAEGKLEGKSFSTRLDFIIAVMDALDKATHAAVVAAQLRLLDEPEGTA
jgi:hypothetical protein